MSFEQFAAGALFAAVVATFALRVRVLTRSGALAAFAVGTLTYGAGGWALTVILLAFFVPSVALSRIGRARKKRFVDIGKGGARDAWQVLANGGVATMCAVAGGIPAARPGDAALWVAAFAGAYAAATADTWGTEIGTLVHEAPRSILTWRPIATGLSGGVTLPGNVAEVAGALWIGLCTVASQHVLGIHRPTVAVTWASGALFGPVVLGGVAGALIDSLLGATVQELRSCPNCARSCETDPHLCGTATLLVRGVRGISNDLVNFAATFTGATTTLLLVAVM